MITPCVLASLVNVLQAHLRTNADTGSQLCGAHVAGYYPVASAKHFVKRKFLVRDRVTIVPSSELSQVFS